MHGSTTLPVVLIVGSLHHDIVVTAPGLPQRDETMVGSAWFPKFGGKGGNQAVASARAGVPARMLGAVGADAFGLALRAGLRAGGVDDQFVTTLTAAGSGMSVAIMDPAGDYAAVIVSGVNLLIDPAALLQDGLWQGVTVLVLQNEVSAALNLAAAQVAVARGVLVVLNAAPMRVLDPAFAPLVDVLVVNAVEAEMLGCVPVTSLDAARLAAAYLAGQFRAVVVTAGGAGLAFASADNVGAIPAQPVTVVSTHGAGDVFTGAFAAALSKGETVADACRAGSTAAAAHVSGMSA